MATLEAIDRMAHEFGRRRVTILVHLRNRTEESEPIWLTDEEIKIRKRAIQRATEGHITLSMPIEGGRRTYSRNVLRNSYIDIIVEHS